MKVVAITKENYHLNYLPDTCGEALPPKAEVAVSSCLGFNFFAGVYALVLNPGFKIQEIIFKQMLSFAG